MFHITHITKKSGTNTRILGQTFWHFFQWIGGGWASEVGPPWPLRSWHGHYYNQDCRSWSGSQLPDAKAKQFLIFKSGTLLGYAVPGSQSKQIWRQRNGRNCIFCNATSIYSWLSPVRKRQNQVKAYLANIRATMAIFTSTHMLTDLRSKHTSWSFTIKRLGEEYNMERIGGQWSTTQFAFHRRLLV